jgi:hypothetical protein
MERKTKTQMERKTETQMERKTELNEKKDRNTIVTRNKKEVYYYKNERQ